MLHANNAPYCGTNVLCRWLTHQSDALLWGHTWMFGCDPSPRWKPHAHRLSSDYAQALEGCGICVRRWLKKPPLTINHTPWKMPNENTQKPPPLPLGTHCELLWTHAKIMRRHLGCSEPAKRLSVFGPAKQQLIRLGLPEKCNSGVLSTWCWEMTIRRLFQNNIAAWFVWVTPLLIEWDEVMVGHSFVTNSSSPVSGHALLFMALLARISKLHSIAKWAACIFFFSWVEQEKLTVMRANESQTPNCVLGGKFQDFGYLTKILSLDSFPTWCQNSRRVNVWTVYRRSLNAQ